MEDASLGDGSAEADAQFSNDRGLAIEVHEDTRWGRPVLAYNLQIPIAGDAARAFAEAQTRLHTLLGTGIRPIPAESLHISVYGVIPVAWESPEKEAAWQRLDETARALVARCCERASPFSLTFERVAVAPHAIIALASESHALIDELRQDLAALAASGGIPRPSYAIVHSTLARFAHSASMAAELVAQATAIPLRATVNVTGVQLVRERVYPSLSLELLAAWSLNARAGRPRTGAERSAGAPRRGAGDRRRR